MSAEEEINKLKELIKEDRKMIFILKDTIDDLVGFIDSDMNHQSSQIDRFDLISRNTEDRLNKVEKIIVDSELELDNEDLISNDENIYFGW